MKLNCKCEKCFYYCKSNNTCQLKKCVSGLEGYVTLYDKTLRTCANIFRIPNRPYIYNDWSVRNDR